MNQRRCRAGPADNSSHDLLIREQAAIVDCVSCFDAFFPESAFIVAVLWPVNWNENYVGPLGKCLQYQEHSKTAGVTVGTGDAFVEHNNSRPISVSIACLRESLQVLR